VACDASLRHLDSNQEGLVNSQFVYLFNGHRNAQDLF
jgi:hypothetical protein